jgi:ribosomal-protein-alanine N-acetyltransferase
MIKVVCTVKIREARLWDWPAIEALARRAYFTSLPMWNWRAFVTDASCVLTEESDRVCGVLFASSDESPVAWVRLAAVEAHLDIGQWLDLSLPRLLGDLQALAVREMAWMDHAGWAGPYLSAHGFRPLVEVITLTKTGRDTPAAGPAGITLRSARRADLEPIVTIDRAAFKPYWWRSEATLGRRAARASQFTVAERRGKVVGYTEWESCPPAAHLNRIAVHPDDQGQGVGRLLLSEVVHTAWRNGVEELSLNTQRHNRRARRLYDTFGFKATGDVAKVWALRV